MPKASVITSSQPKSLKLEPQLCWALFQGHTASEETPSLSLHTCNPGGSQRTHDGGVVKSDKAMHRNRTLGTALEAVQQLGQLPLSFF